MRRSRRILGYDAALVVAATLIIAYSIYLLGTAIVRPDGSVTSSFWHRQLIFAIIGVGISIVVSRVPIGFWERYWPHALALAILTIGSVMAFGTVVNGARRWIDLGPIALQPSEIGKVLALMAIAGFLGSRARDVRSPRVFALGLALLAVPAMFVFLQPDFGTAQVYGWLALGALFFAGARWTHFAILGSSVVIASVIVLGVLPAIGVEVLHDYQMQRLTGFLNPEADPEGTNYQTIQAKIAIGSGQLAGRPADEATQVKQAFLPEPQTDFIFATLCERHGFLGGALLLTLYLLLISRMLYAVGVAASPFARLVAGGVAVLFFSQVVINVGMVIGVLPVTGVPLPLFSYGGSALWANLAAIGLVAAVLRETETPRVRYERRTGRPVGGFASLRQGGQRASTTGARSRTRVR